MKIFISAFVILLLATAAFSQTAPNKYLIQFTDKNGTPYSITQPQDFLSARAILRRANQNILITDNDLPVNSTYVDSLKSLGLTVLNTSKWFNNATVYTTDTLLIDTIDYLSFVSGYSKSIQLKLNVNNNNIELNNELYTSKQTNFYDYGAGTNQIEMLNGHILHNHGFTGSGKIIAVLDAGFNNVDSLEIFDSLWINNQIIATHDFVANNDTLNFASSTHGMAVLSTMGGNLPGQLVGTAPKAMYMLLRTEDTSSEYLVEEDNWVSGAEYADSAGADIITSSLGYTTFNDPSQSHTYNDMDGNTTRVSIAADIASSKGILVLTSAGNDGASAWHYISAPADADSVLSIGAVNGAGNYASFSSTGPTYDGRIKPNITAQGEASAIVTSSGIISYGTGTSFSCPITAGLVACLWQEFPALTNMELKDVIEQSASQYANPDSLLGYGIPDFAYASLILNGVDYRKDDTESLVNVYPNPLSDRFYIDFYSVDSQDVNINIYDIYGKQMLTETKTVNSNSFNQYNYNLKHLSNGIYIINIITTNKTYKHKIIKQ